MDLMQAHNRWATEPDDNRHFTVADGAAAARRFRDSAEQVVRPGNMLEVRTRGGELVLANRQSGGFLDMSNAAFGRLCQLAGCPADYLSRLPADLAATNLNYGLRKNVDSMTPRALLVGRQDSDVRPTLYGITSERFDLVWDADWLSAIDTHLVRGMGFRVPAARPARPGQKGIRKATLNDVMPGSLVNVGDDIAPAGVYTSETGSFVALLHPSLKVRDMSVALMLWNRQDGMGSIGGLVALVDYICGNHIYWGAEIAGEFSIRHLKGETSALTLARAKDGLANAVESLTVNPRAEEKILQASNTFLGSDKESAIERALEFARVKRLALLTKGKLETAFDVAEATPRYGNPTSVWGLVSGLTDERTSPRNQSTARLAYDRQVGRLMELA